MIERLHVLRDVRHMQECPAIAPSCTAAVQWVVEAFDISCAKTG